METQHQTQHGTVTLHAPPNHTSLHVGDHELKVEDGKVTVPAQHVDEAKSHGFSETPHKHIKENAEADRFTSLERRVVELETRLAALEDAAQTTTSAKAGKGAKAE